MVLNPKLLEDRADDLGALAEVVPGDTREEVVFDLGIGTLKAEFGHSSMYALAGLIVFDQGFLLCRLSSPA